MATEEIKEENSFYFKKFVPIITGIVVTFLSLGKIANIHNLKKEGVTLNHGFQRIQCIVTVSTAEIS